MFHYYAGVSVQVGRREFGVEVGLMYSFLPTIRFIWELH